MGMTIIKNYGMPHNCYDCDLHNYHECDLTGESIEEDYCWNGDSREKHCPLREIEAIEALEQEPTAKNDLGVDCISREQALVAIRNLYPGMPRVDFNGSLRKWVDKYKPYIECDDAIKELPSVTPQEPFINKPCISSGVCEHDKNVALDKIRAEIEQITDTMGVSYNQYVSKIDVLQIIDKYKAESEG